MFVLKKSSYINDNKIMKLLNIILFLILSQFSIFSQEINDQLIEKLYQVSEQWLGTPYLYGGLSKYGVDCSGLAKVIYKDVFDIELPNRVSNQKNLGVLVKDNNFQPGDLLFFNTTGEISHVGIFLYDTFFIHAASQGPNIGVIKSSLNEKYYKERFIFAKRLLNISNQNNIDNHITKEKNDYFNTEIKIGKVLYRDKIYEETLFFKENKKIFIRTEPFNQDLNLTLEKEDKNIEKIENDFLILEKGIYSIKLKDKANNLIKEVKINVEQ